MKIDKNGYKLSTNEEIKAEYEQQLQEKYGSDFYIKPEGVIDNIVDAAAGIEAELQEQIAFLASQYDPENAQAVWQDALYERIGVSRLDEESTVFIKKINGQTGYNGVAGGITIRSSSTSYDFVNTTDYLIEDDGTADVQFKSVESGAITVNADEKFTIVEAPNEITGISEEAATQIATGRERESDEDFRIRFRGSKSQNARCTNNAVITNLLKYADDISYLGVYDKKSDNTMELGELKIIAKHNTTDEVFAQAIFETIGDGVELLGDTSILVKDDSNRDITIKWKNADEINMEIKADIKVRSGYVANTVIANAKQSILNYIDKRIFGLESIIYATEFIVPILQIDGVEAVTEIFVKKASDSAFSDSVNLTREEFPAFASERITLSETN